MSDTITREEKWSDVFWKYVKMGHDRSSAAFEADKRARRQCSSTHCERRQECASPSDCHGDFGMEGFKLTKDWLEKQIHMTEIIEWKETAQVSQNLYLALCKAALKSFDQPARNIEEEMMDCYQYGTVPAPKYLLIKRGMYWRPNAQGYTSSKLEAGRYSDKESADWVEHGSGEITRILDDQPAPPADVVMVSKEWIAFLMGEAPINGFWFGQKKEGIPFWWRSELRAMIAAATEKETNQSPDGIALTTAIHPQGKPAKGDLDEESLVHGEYDDETGLIKWQKDE